MHPLIEPQVAEARRQDLVRRAETRRRNAVARTHPRRWFGLSRERDGLPAGELGAPVVVRR